MGVRQMILQFAQIKVTVDGQQQVVRRDEILEVVKL